MKKDERLNFSDRTPSVRRLVVSLVLMLLAALPAAAQNKKITVDLDNVPVREFIKTVESQSGYTFAYNNSEIDLTRRVSVKAADENVVDVVIRALSAQNRRVRPCVVLRFKGQFLRAEQPEPPAHMANREIARDFIQIRPKRAVFMNRALPGKQPRKRFDHQLLRVVRIVNEAADIIRQRVAIFGNQLLRARLVA